MSEKEMNTTSTPDSDGFRRSGTTKPVETAEQKARRAQAQANASEAQRIENARQKDRELKNEQSASTASDEQAAPAEVRMPQYDPKDPYKFPAQMPSSADSMIRSFDPADFPQPKAKDNEWRYLDMDKISEFMQPFTPTNLTQVSVSFEDGSAVPQLSDKQASHELGVSFGQISKNEYPAGSVSKPVDLTAAIQWQVTQRVYWLNITSDVEKPVIIRVHSNNAERDALHFVITAAANSHASVVVMHDGLAHLAEGMEISTGADSTLNFTTIQQWDEASKHVGTERIRVGANAELRHRVVTLSGNFVRLRMDPDYAGKKGFLDMLGIYYVLPGDYAEHRTMVCHNQADCKSRVIYKGALDGKGARSAWVGNALILPTAPNTDSYELNRNLVLKPGAIADSEPQLEIENGDIIGAGHASSVGRFEDEQLFYLESRGVSEENARKLVVRGFFEELINQIGVESVQTALMQRIEERLAKGESAAMTQVLEDK